MTNRCHFEREIALTPEQLAKTLDDYGLAGYYDAARAQLRNAIVLECDKCDAASAPGASRLGGRPDLPSTLDWPRHQGRPLAFIAQIDCAQAQPCDLAGELPAQGWLYLFYDAQGQPWGFDPADRGGVRVLFHAGDCATLAPRPFPDDLPDEARFAAAALRFAACADLPDPDSHLLDCTLDDDEHEAWLDLCEDRVLARGCGTLLGHSRNIQNGQELQCELVSNGLYCGNASGYQDPRRAQLEAGSAQWRLLLQLEGVDDCGMQWGGSGRLYVWLRAQDLREHRFENAWAILQCH